METSAGKPTRDIQKNYPKAEFIDKLRRLADCLESGDRFVISVAGERIYVPAGAEISVEHERGEDSEELEFQLRWTVKSA